VFEIPEIELPTLTIVPPPSEFPTLYVVPSTGFADKLADVLLITRYPSGLPVAAVNAVLNVEVVIELKTKDVG
jgi:hypothetical protein